VIEVLKEGDKVTGVRVKDRLTGAIKEVKGKVVINCCGPWSPILGERAKVKIELRPTKGIHVVFNKRFTNYGIVTTAIDGRVIFMIPCEDFTLLGTTDDDYFGDLDHITVLWDEVQYLLQSIKRVYPEIFKYRIIDTLAGIRATIFEYGVNENNLSRDYRIIDHGEEGAKGLFSLIGGKLAEYRLMAEETVDTALNYLNMTGECKTSTIPLPGAERKLNIKRLPEYYGISLPIINSLYKKYGCRIEQVLDPVFKDPRLRAIVCECKGVIAAEVKYAVEVESARTLEDVMRRTSLGRGSCGGVRCGLKAAMIIGDILGWNYKKIEESAKRFIEGRWRRRKVVAIDEAQIKREFLNRIYLGE